MIAALLCANLQSRCSISSVRPIDLATLPIPAARSSSEQSASGHSDLSELGSQPKPKLAHLNLVISIPHWATESDTDPYGFSHLDDLLCENGWYPNLRQVCPRGSQKKIYCTGSANFFKVVGLTLPPTAGITYHSKQCFTRKNIMYVSFPGFLVIYTIIGIHK